MTPVVALTIAGSDSGGGAGIQADLAVFAAKGVFGASAVTAVTAQDTVRVHAIHPVPAAVVVAQIEAVLDDLPVAAVKTGMLGSAAVVAAVADLAAAGRLPNLVVDPVLIASSGDPLLDPGAVRLSFERLVPHCRVVTPNRSEAGTLLGREVHDLDDVRDAARALAGHGPGVVVVTGGPAGGEHPDETIDIAVVDGVLHELRTAAIATRNDHGTGCAYSAAVTAGLARGLAPLDALRHATAYVQAALDRAAAWQLGSGHGPLDHLRQETT